MERQDKNIKDREKEYYAIDLFHIAKSLWKKAWLIVVVGLLTGMIGFVYSAFFVAPTYSSSVMLYVNNSSVSIGDASISFSSSEITAAQSLVKTYSVILKSRATLERVIEESGVSYTYKELVKMVSAGAANDTEILKVTVTTEDPYEAVRIANCIAEVLRNRISAIIDGASMEVVDDAVPDLQKVGPSITKYTAVGLILGALVCALGVAIAAMLDDTIHDEEYVLQTYDYPILAKIPDLMNTGTKRYGYYYQRKHHSDKKEQN
ncbi:MAG: hypothetical protein IJX08_04950 [Clostridia bacterium]|nr:hypothetical protein [Clostridia bacterium]